MRQEIGTRRTDKHQENECSGDPDGAVQLCSGVIIFRSIRGAQTAIKRVRCLLELVKELVAVQVEKLSVEVDVEDIRGGRNLGADNLRLGLGLSRSHWGRNIVAFNVWRVCG